MGGNIFRGKYNFFSFTFQYILLIFIYTFMPTTIKLIGKARKMAQQKMNIPGSKKPDIEINKPEQQKIWHDPWKLFIWYLIFTAAFFYFSRMAAEAQQKEIPYSKFQEYVKNKKVDSLIVSQNKIVGILKTGEIKGAPRYFITIPPPDDTIARFLNQYGIHYTVHIEDQTLNKLFFDWLLPIAIFVIIWVFLSRRMSSMGSGVLNIGRNRARIHADEGPKVTFKDVAGVNEAKIELEEVIKFLKDSDYYKSLGGHMPKGVLLVGPPGTGKTLLAKAVAGEADVPFFSMSGSDFIEMFVGVGAARVRDLFEQARKKAPCIIFIDELDAIGRSRGAAGMVGGHDEREQTLNQLLVEMDGFDTTSGVVVMAATNRPEILDKALLRAGRFDRQVVVDKPDYKDRIEILKIHIRKLKLGEDINLEVIAQRTPGFVGADLANICNEAAILAARHGHKAVLMSDFEAAIDRVLAGPEKKNRVLSSAEKKRVAYHESGHALVAVSVPTGEPVHKVSIIPRGIGALGYTLQLPVEEKYLSTKNELLDQIAILLGGRVAEEIIFGDVSSGAQNDLERASGIARAMVTRLGMSDALGPITYGEEQRSQFLGVSAGTERNFSEATAKQIDDEVKKIITDNLQRVRLILNEQKDHLEKLTAHLYEKEVIDGRDVYTICGLPLPEKNKD